MNRYSNQECDKFKSSVKHSKSRPSTSSSSSFQLVMSFVLGSRCYLSLSFSRLKTYAAPLGSSGTLSPASRIPSQPFLRVYPSPSPCHSNLCYTFSYSLFTSAWKATILWMSLYINTIMHNTLPVRLWIWSGFRADMDIFWWKVLRRGG